MEHEDYIKKRDEILGKLIVATQDLDFRNAHPNTQQHHDNRKAAAQAIDALVLEVIGKDLSINNPTEGQRGRLRHAYAIKDAQRRIVQGDKS